MLKIDYKNESAISGLLRLGTLQICCNLQQTVALQIFGKFSFFALTPIVSLTWD